MSCGGVCGKCKGIQCVVLGILIVANAWQGYLDWAMFIGIIILVSGLARWFKPTCGCMDADGSAMMSAKKRR